VGDCGRAIEAGLWRSAKTLMRRDDSQFNFCLVRMICVIAVSNDESQLFAGRAAIFWKRNFCRHFNAPLTKFADGII
jgi:hypothetical protein